MVSAYEEGKRRILGDKKFVALASDRKDAEKILPDLRLLIERRKLTSTPAEIVAHKLESYLRDPVNRKVNFALRFVLDRTQQDDLPRPKTKAREPPRSPEALPARSIRKPAPLTPEEQKDLDELKQRLKGGSNGTS